MTLKKKKKEIQVLLIKDSSEPSYLFPMQFPSRICFKNVNLFLLEGRNIQFLKVIEYRLGTNLWELEII